MTGSESPRIAEWRPRIRARNLLMDAQSHLFNNYFTTSPVWHTSPEGQAFRLLRRCQDKVQAEIEGKESV